MRKISLPIILLLLIFSLTEAQTIRYVPKFTNENHPEIGYWFISPSLLPNDNYLVHLDTIVQKCPYTLLFLTARDGANFYNYSLMHPVFQKIVSQAHKKGLKVGLQLWGNYKDTSTVGSQRMIIENEVLLDQSGYAGFTVKAKYVRFPDRLLHSDLFKVYAFKKTSEGFYDPTTLKDITAKCEAITPDKETVQVKIRGGENVKGYSFDALPKLGIVKNLLPDGCKNEDGSFVFTDRTSLVSDAMATFSLNIGGDKYKGTYKGLAVIAADKNSGLKKFTAAGFTELSRNGKVILSFKNPVDLFLEKQDGKYTITIANITQSVVPLINKL